MVKEKEEEEEERKEVEDEEREEESHTAGEEDQHHRQPSLNQPARVTASPLTNRTDAGWTPLRLDL